MVVGCPTRQSLVRRLNGIAYLMVVLAAVGPQESMPARRSSRLSGALRNAARSDFLGTFRRSDLSAARPLGRWPLVLGAVLCLLTVMVWWTWRALHDPHPLDTGLAWDAGRLAWANGHPERLATWNGMTFLVAAMALLGRVASRQHAADLVTIVNLAVAVGLAAVVLGAMRRRLPARWWWVVAFALVSFGPLMSTVWWKQFNLLALALAAGGFELARRDRRGTGAFAIALSVSIKPLAFVLPVVMLVRRDTRRVGLAAILWIAALDVAAQALLALRAGDLATLDPTIGPRNLIHKTSAAGNLFLCLPVNFSPTSLLCRLNGGDQHWWTLQRILALVLVGVLALWVVQSLRGRSALSWDLFAFACPFSVMLSALSWPHYQIMLAPLFLLLVVRLHEDGTTGEWLGFLIAFAMASLIWAPFGNVIDGLRNLPENPQTTNFVEVYAQFAQYLLILTGALWYTRHRYAVVRDRGAAPPT
jgi:hypothetical protein